MTKRISDSFILQYAIEDTIFYCYTISTLNSDKIGKIWG